MSPRNFGTFCACVLGVLYACAFVAFVAVAQTPDREIRAMAEIFYEDVTPPRDVRPYIEFAREVATAQRERDAQLAEKMGAPAIARAIRGGR